MGRNKKNKEGKKHVDKTEIATQNELDHEGTVSVTKQSKRELSDDLLSKTSQSSDHEHSNPKKLKKDKKTSVTAETKGKKNKMSIRQMKREKYTARLAIERAHAKDQLKTQCLNYLSQWKHDKQNWKFMKAKQVWLYKNKFSVNLIPDANWPLLLEYFESAQGNIKNMLLNDATKIIKQMDEWTESQNGVSDEEPITTEVTKPDETIYNRARALIQCLQE